MALIVPGLSQLQDTHRAAIGWVILLNENVNIAHA